MGWDWILNHLIPRAPLGGAKKHKYYGFWVKMDYLVPILCEKEPKKSGRGLPSPPWFGQCPKVNILFFRRSSLECYFTTLTDVTRQSPLPNMTDDLPNQPFTWLTAPDLFPNYRNNNQVMMRGVRLEYNLLTLQSQLSSVLASRLLTILILGSLLLAILIWEEYLQK